ncbi:MAG: response regulator [Thermodesulfobacteriota bacterium]
MSEIKDLIAIFRAETEEHLTRLDNGLVALEKEPGNLELISSLNREVHTLKGAARVFGFREIQDIAHRIEDLFEAIAGKQATFNSQMAEKIFRGVDVIRSILENIAQEKETHIDVSGLCRALEECLSATQGISLEKKEEESDRSEDEVGAAPAGAIEPEKRSDQGKEEEEIKTQEERKTPDEVADRISGATPPRPSAPMEEYIRVPLSRVDKLLYLVGEVVIYKMSSSSTIAQAKRVSRLSKEVQKSILSAEEVIKREFPSPEGEATRWLSQCEAQMQKLREHALKLYDDLSRESYHIDPVIDELQARVKEIKMFPLSTIFEAFSRMIRDIASQQGKEVDLVISGEETELDKRVLEGIKVSLIHILRNCVDHGIERPAKRTALGKPRCGTIKVSAFHEAGNVVITVEDDGRGMDLDQIRQTAIDKNLFSREDLEGMTEKEILNIVFMNGYSTSPTVTEVSGRGMGLDIVKRDIAHLKGRVILETQKDQGTKFTLVLPLTIAIIQVLLVKVQGMLFALPMLSITENIKVDMKEVFTLEGRMAILVREQVVPLVKLSEVLRLPAPEDGEEENKELFVAIAASLENRVGFIADEIIGDEEVFLKSLGKHLGKVHHVSGAVILGSGEVVPVLDIPELIASSALQVPVVSDKRDSHRVKRKENKILVVEDVFSTRELEKSILEAHGYVVDTAVDGLDALDRMSAGHYDLIISDVEMPRMDGFELCRHVKQREHWKDIPFVMVTSMQKEEDKRRGLEVGAAAYIVKSGFEQTNLLDTIERLVG